MSFCDKNLYLHIIGKLQELTMFLSRIIGHLWKPRLLKKIYIYIENSLKFGNFNLL